MAYCKISSALSATKMRGAPAGNISESTLSMRRCDAAPGEPNVRANTGGAELVFAGRLTEADQARRARGLAQGCPALPSHTAGSQGVLGDSDGREKSPKGALATGKR